MRVSWVTCVFSPRGHSAMSGDIFYCLCWKGMLLGSREERPRVLLDIRHAWGNPPQQRTIQSTMSMALRLRSYVISHHKTEGLESALAYYFSWFSGPAVVLLPAWPGSPNAPSDHLSQLEDWLSWKVQDSFTNRSDH